MEQRVRRVPPPGLGPMLNRARMRAGLRGPEAAREIGISRHYMFRLETGARCPSLAVAERMAVVLKLTPGERAELLAAAVVKPDRKTA